MDIRESDIYYRRKVEQANKFYHHFITLNIFKDAGNEEQKIIALEALSFFNWKVHSGRYTSNFIDLQIQKLSTSLQLFSTPQYSQNNLQNTVVYIATSLYSVGGHTKLLENIAKFEHQRGANAILILTGQKEAEIPERVSQLNCFNKIICFKQESRVDKISAIRNIIKGAKRIYNLQHPDDIIPSIALNLKERPYVIYVNHADHVFWVGASFCDCILNIRPFGNSLTLTRRNNKVPSIILPVKLNVAKKIISKEIARNQLDIRPDTKVLLTISDVYKIFPDKNYNFLRTIKQIIFEHPDVIYYFIGVNNEEYINIMNEPPPKQLILLGVLEDISLYQTAADVYLEGMPYNSLTALLESIYAGAFPVLLWGPYHISGNMEDELYIQKIIMHSKDESSYHKEINKVLSEIGSKEQQSKISSIKKLIENYSSDVYWTRVIDNISSDIKVSDHSSIVEFEIRKSDLRLAEAWETYWRQKNNSPFLETLKRAKKCMTIRERIFYYFKYILQDREYSFFSQVKFIRRFFLNNSGV